MSKAEKCDEEFSPPPTLVEVLSDPHLRDWFQRCCEEQHTEENLLFWFDAEIYGQLTDQEELMTKAKEMCEVCNICL
jgi:hypothetical protein